MCGPLALGFGSTRARLALYHIGRLAAYMILGAVLGSVSPFASRASEASSESSWLWASAWYLLSSITIVVMAVVLIASGWRLWQGRPFHFHALSTIYSQFAKCLLPTRMQSSAWPLTPLITGALTLFLPCGHLYTFLIGATATGTTYKAMAFMAAFWLGTLPALGFAAHWLRRGLAGQTARAQRLAATALVLAGLVSLAAFAVQFERAHFTLGPNSGLDSSASKAAPPLVCH